MKFFIDLLSISRFFMAKFNHYLIYKSEPCINWRNLCKVWVSKIKEIFKRRELNFLFIWKQFKVLCYILYNMTEISHFSVLGWNDVLAFWSKFNFCRLKITWNIWRWVLNQRMKNNFFTFSLFSILFSTLITADRVAEKIYVGADDNTQCFRLLNGTHQIGCQCKTLKILKLLRKFTNIFSVWVR